VPETTTSTSTSTETYPPTTTPDYPGGYSYLPPPVYTTFVTSATSVAHPEYPKKHGSGKHQRPHKHGKNRYHHEHENEDKKKHDWRWWH